MLPTAKLILLNKVNFGETTFALIHCCKIKISMFDLSHKLWIYWMILREIWRKMMFLEGIARRKFVFPGRINLHNSRMNERYIVPNWCRLNKTLRFRTFRKANINVKIKNIKSSLSHSCSILATKCIQSCQNLNNVLWFVLYYIGMLHN